MKKIFKILLMMMVMVVGVEAVGETLMGGIVYTVESARREAFDGIEYEISMEPYRGYMVDPGFAPGKSGGKAKISKRGRWVTVFADGEYGVMYHDDNNRGYYYDVNGQLIEIEIRKKNRDYPYLSVKYGVNGKLNRVLYHVGFNETFVYDARKYLTGHWLNNNCYDANGVLIDKRKN